MDPVTFVLSLVPIRFAAPVLACIALCSMIDAALPQPAAGSAWVIPRKVISFIGANFANARNQIRPGSEAATVVPADVLNALTANHVEAKVAREDLAATIEQVPGKLTDLTGRVNAALQATTQIKQAIGAAPSLPPPP